MNFGRASLLAFYDLADADLAQLVELRAMFEKHADSLVAAFYRHLLSFAETRSLLRDPKVTERLLGEQRKYLLSLADPVIDDAYLAQRRHIGEVHERIGLAPTWYLGAYALYVSLLSPIFEQSFPGELEKAARLQGILGRRLRLDAALALETYVDRRERDLEYLNQQLAEAGRKLARDLASTGVELRSSRARAQAAERLASIGTLVAGLAHEIGTPMGVIQGHAKLLEPAVQDENARWRLRTIQAQIARIARIVESLLNMARPSSRRTRVPVVLEALLDGTLAFPTERLTRRRIEVVRDYAEAPSIIADAEALQQIFLNLIMNAIDAMPNGGRLRIAIAPLRDGGAEVCVADTGSGISPALQQRIFDPFFTTKEAGQGHGLGLAVAQGIAHDHGGEIEIARSGPDGTQFRVRLGAE
ncbi:MAG: protoglobin domain-containing protein [Myxococcota bacterium]